GNPTGTRFRWDLGNGDTSDLSGLVQRYSDPGTYVVTLFAETPAGCSATSAPLVVTALLTPRASFLFDPQQPESADAAVLFVSTTTGADDLTWTFSDGFTTTEPRFFHTFPDTGTYTVHVLATNDLGCTDQDSANIRVAPTIRLVVPNAFTPSRFGPSGGLYDPNALNNDVFYPLTEFVLEYHLSIYNRWGELVFESFDLSRGWDGYVEGELSPLGVYVWKIEAVYPGGQRIEKVGDVTLLR
ncbi:MAG: PKD domain-containing protein, partial [Bacteroidota bacterium]